MLYAGNDLNDGRTDRRNSPEECQILCQRTSGCVGWEWGSYGGDACWVKSKLESPKIVSSALGLVAGKRNSSKTKPGKVVIAINWVPLAKVG